MSHRAAAFDALTRQVSDGLATTPIGYLELRGPGGVVLRLLNQEGRIAAAPASYEPRTATAATRPVSAPSVGVLLHTHPLHDKPLAVPGQLVAAGEVLALLQVGALLLPVRAPQAGVVTRVQAAHGSLVGWGDTLFELATLAAVPAPPASP